MAISTSDWKLGLFVVLALAGAFFAAVFLGATDRDRVVYFVSYFDESVQGLEVGAPVKLRGVTIGDVSEVGFAPDGRHVAVTLDLRVSRLEELGLRPGASEDDGGRRLQGDSATVPDTLRVQVVAAGITGLKFINANFFERATAPPALDFAPPPNYIPSAPSTFASLEEGLGDVLDRARSPRSASRRSSIS